MIALHVLQTQVKVGLLVAIVKLFNVLAYGASVTSSDLSFD
jgi:hypothetical protein